MHARAIGAAAGGLVAGLLIAGCAGMGAGTRPAATEQGCYAFGVRALQRHVTVTAVPRACAGLSQVQVNQAVARAVREVAGARPKAARRRLADQEGARLERLLAQVKTARGGSGPGSVAAAAARPGSDSPLTLGALAAWLVTAGAGGYLLLGWLRPGHGSAGRDRRAGGAMPPQIVLGHFGVAVGGLALWAAFAATGVAALAWIGFGLVLVAAGLGMASLVTTLPEPGGSGSAGTGPAGAGRSAGAARRGTGRQAPGPAGRGSAGTGFGQGASAEETLAGAVVATSGPSRGATGKAGRIGSELASSRSNSWESGGRRVPAGVIALHGVLATATILLVLLAAVGAS